MLGIKSNIRTSVGVLALGVAGLLSLVYLSAAPDQALKPGDRQNTGNVANPVADNIDVKPRLDNGPDPFKEQLNNQQANKLMQARTETSIPTVPKGTDPFKEQLVQQSKQVSVSPFSN